MQDISDIRELEQVLGLSLSRYYPDEAIQHPGIHLNNVTRNLAGAIKNADPLAIEDACKLIALDPRLPFGKLIKSDLARALKKSARYVSSQNRARIGKTTAALLSLEHCPRETEDYCKLIKKFGETESIAVLELTNATDKKSMVLAAYLEPGT